MQEYLPVTILENDEEELDSVDDTVGDGDATDPSDNIDTLETIAKGNDNDEDDEDDEE